jgi:hypothetical protein
VTIAWLASSGDENVFWPFRWATERPGNHTVKRSAKAANLGRSVLWHVSSYPDLSRWGDCFPPGEPWPKSLKQPVSIIFFFIRIFLEFLKLSSIEQSPQVELL